MLLTPPHLQRHTPGTLHLLTLRAPPYTHARCNQRIPAVSDATNVSLQHIPATYVYNVSLQHIPTSYLYNITPIHIPTIYPSHISL